MEELVRPEMNIRRRVLVVDDEEVNRRLLGFIVERDHQVLYAENGVQAMEIIRANQDVLSLVLLDLLMPEMDGYAVLEAMRGDPVLRHIPVIVLTSERDAEVKSLKLGAADFIPKPYDMPEVILARVQRSIELAEDKVMIKEAENDELTGLYTKEFFFQYGRMRDRYCPDVTMDAVVINVNRFHLINEMHGRSYGDRLLCAIARTVNSLLGGSDGLACRVNPDTFYVYLPHREDYEDIIEHYSRELDKGSEFSRVSLRIGIYAEADKGLDLEQRFDRANAACARLRSVYSTSLVYYDTELHEKELYSERLIDEMDRALAEKQFIVYYQPKYNITGDKPVLASAEALIRWVHPELGMISPGSFIPLFEANGLIQKLDRYVWNEAAAQIRSWRDRYGRVVPVSVNVSRVDIYDEGLEEELLKITSEAGLSPQEYLLEITESAYTDNSQQIIDTVTKLRDDGFRVEMDDFGSGYSSLNMLAELPIDALKLDMAFIRKICDSEKDLKMVGLMLDIAGFLGVPVIAEGVETEEQYRLLKEAGCDLIQGYYFSRPLPPEDFDRLIEAELS